MQKVKEDKKLIDSQNGEPNLIRNINAYLWKLFQSLDNPKDNIIIFTLHFT